MTRTFRNRPKIEHQIALVLMLLLGGMSVSAQVAITPSAPPVVTEGTTFKFTANVAVTWSCPGCAGTIDPDGTYHAPASVISQQSYGGYQVLPNNHIYNTRIDSLPVNSSSSAWIAGTGTVPLSYIPSFPINYMNGSTPTISESFLYTPQNNGVFEMPALPGLRVECGSIVPVTYSCDRHILSIDTTTGIFQEIYQQSPAGTISGCATCTADSGVRYPNSTYALPSDNSTDAAGLYVMPLTLRLQEWEHAFATGGSINHALRFTIQSGYIASSFIWPATSYASDGGTVPFGARFRLKSSFNISTFSPLAQILLKQLQQYGIILADGGTGWQITTEYTRWPAAYYNVLYNEIPGAYISPSDFEAIDESGLEVSAQSGLTTAAERVVATSSSNPSQTAKQQVVLTGVTITLPKDELYIQANTAAQQFTAFINGSANTGITWTMSPTVGSLTSEGLYTPPASVSAAAVATVTATSNADSAVAASMTVTVFPTGSVYLVVGQSSPYTDTSGNVWQPLTGDDGCFPYANGRTWASNPNIALYDVPCLSYYDTNDMSFDLTVPNGTYQIDAKFGEPESSGTAASRFMDLEVQGSEAYSNVNIASSAGGVDRPLDFTMPATVTNGTLSFVLRHIGGDFTIISALSIVPLSGGTTGASGPPAPPTNLKGVVETQ